jgi:hypothetical protein
MRLVRAIVICLVVVSVGCASPDARVQENAAEDIFEDVEFGVHYRMIGVSGDERGGSVGIAIAEDERIRRGELVLPDGSSYRGNGNDYPYIGPFDVPSPRSGGGTCIVAFNHISPEGLDLSGYDPEDLRAGEQLVTMLSICP